MTERDTHRWKKPGRNTVKANWDAAINTTTKKMGIGAIIRDSEGDYGYPYVPSKRHILQSAIDECLQRAKEICSKLGFTNSIFEGDS